MKKNILLQLLCFFGALSVLFPACRAFAAPPLPLNEVRFWAYQIQGLSLPGAVEALAASNYDMLVVEPTRTDREERDFDTAGMVARLQATKASDGKHRKLVLAYIDIGQAEDWRWYWTWSYNREAARAFPKDWPSFITAVDPDGWDGNYVVNYWAPGWKAIVWKGVENTSGQDFTSILDEVLRDGFDGVYLDWVEAFENPGVIAAASAQGKDPKAEMVQLIKEIRQFGRRQNPNFLVVQQNAAALLEERPELCGVVDGVAQEEVWFGGVATDDWSDPAGYDARIDRDLTQEYLSYLDAFKRCDAGGDFPVLNVEYALKYAAQAYELSAKFNFVPYVTRRSLGRISTTAPPGLK